MNKKNSIFVIIGIFLICTRFWVSFGTVNIDISNDIIDTSLYSSVSII